MLGTYLNNVREKSPIIHSITNYVTVNDVANMILACGANPIMADEPDEVEEVTALCQGLNINIGTLNTRTIPSMLRAARCANKLGHPVVLDPVGAGASKLRTKTAIELVDNISFTVIKGNISEIKTLAFGMGNTKGVDADAADRLTMENKQQTISFLKKFAQERKTILAVTGETDLVTDGTDCFLIYNGREEMSRITGTGCQLSGLIASFLAANENASNKNVANENEVLEAVAAAVCTMGVAGEIAWDNMQPGDGNATYRNRMIDAVSNMDGSTLDKYARYERIL